MLELKAKKQRNMTIAIIALKILFRMPVIMSKVSALSP